MDWRREEEALDQGIEGKIGGDCELIADDGEVDGGVLEELRGGAKAVGGREEMGCWFKGRHVCEWRRCYGILGSEVSGKMSVFV